MRAKRSHEETWHRIDVAAVVTSLDEHEGEPVALASSPERADLLTQAPAMARLLLRLEWASAIPEHLGGFRCCAVCDGVEPDSGYSGVSWKTGHAPDCALVATLRAAGVVE